MADSERVAIAGPAHPVSTAAHRLQFAGPAELEDAGLAVREPSGFISAIGPSGSLAPRKAEHFSCTGGSSEDA